MATATDRSQPPDPQDDTLLIEARVPAEGERLLTVSQAARMLGLSSPTTIRNWLENGRFPGATRTSGGHRRFRPQDVRAAMARMSQTRAENAAGVINFSDYGDADPYAGR